MLPTLHSVFFCKQAGRRITMNQANKTVMNETAERALQTYVELTTTSGEAYENYRGMMDMLDSPYIRSMNYGLMAGQNSDEDSQLILNSIKVAVGSVIRTITNNANAVIADKEFILKCIRLAHYNALANRTIKLPFVPHVYDLVFLPTVMGLTVNGRSSDLLSAVPFQDTDLIKSPESILEFNSLMTNAIEVRFQINASFERLIRDQNSPKYAYPLIQSIVESPDFFTRAIKPEQIIDFITFENNRKNQPDFNEITPMDFWKLSGQQESQEQSEQPIKSKTISTDFRKKD